MPNPPSRAGAVLAWAGAILFPFALFAVIDMSDRVGNLLQVPALLLTLLLPLGLARRSPVQAVVTVFAGMTAVAFLFVGDFYGRTLVIIMAIVTDVLIGSVAATRSRGVSTTVAALTAAGVSALAVIVGDFPDVPVVVTTVLLGAVTAWVIGDSVRQRRRHAAAQREQAAARAVEAERLRIARELHDMVAHSIAVIAVQAGVGRRVIDSQPGEARIALANIEDTSRETAAALRRMLGSLRRTDAGGVPAPRDPAPGLDDLDGLVARSAQAGVTVELHRTGERAPLPPDIDLSAFRIVQEAVTNVIRHAGVGRCDVTVQQDDGTLTIEIADEGRGPGHGGGGGNGLTGMRERVSLLGGEFDAGERPGGGFRISARIPLPGGAR